MGVWDLRASFTPSIRKSEFSASKPLPTVFDYAQPPDYLASFAFTEKPKSKDHSEEALCSPIVALKQLHQQQAAPNSFQFCSLNSRGNLLIWMVLAVRPKSINGVRDMAGSITDLGLRPGSSVRLMQLARINTEEQPIPRVGCLFL